MTAIDDVGFDIKDYQKIVREKPVAYVETVLGINPWSKQKEILRACSEYNRVAVKSGNGVGKTYLTASIICQYLDSHVPAYAVVSGATWTSVQKTVMPTLRRVVKNSNVDLGGELTLSEWKRGDQWGAFAISPKDPEAFAGYRTEHGALVIIDEASALEGPVFEAILGLCSAKGSKIVLLGNPLRPEGPFYDCFSDPDWKTFSISSLEVSELNIAGLATTEYCEMMERKWGKESPVYHARVLGEFPDSLLNGVIPLGWLKDFITDKDTKRKGTLYLGADIARYGDDRTVFYVRDDNGIIEEVIKHGQNLMVTTGQILALMKKYSISEENVVIDDGGLGGGVTDRLEEQGIYVTAVNFGQAAEESKTFFNSRAELYWRMREAVNPENEDSTFKISTKYMDLAKESTWAQYKMTSTGKIQLESKDDIKKRKVQSPDLADALALTFAKTGSDFTIGF